jgi:hypothetical protein
MLTILLSPFFLGTNSTNDNGITVGEPKQYPYRHLERMIADLDSQLAQIRAIDATTIAQQIGALQGSTKRSSQLGLKAEELPIPGVTTTLEADESGQLKPKTATLTEAAVTPTAPTLDALSGGRLASPNFGFAASDILSEQIRLQYQVYNLRLLQQRSISDRFFDDGTNQGSRVLALIGVSVSIVPRREHRNFAAVVELSIQSKDASKKSPSLVALMPEKKTYNSVAHSEKSNAFGGAALAGVFSLGFSGKWKSEKLYLYQDSDTLAFRKPPKPRESTEQNNPEVLEFGWQFRPVLGRTSVEPGIRHLFAVVALDELDEVGSKSFAFDVTANTYWKKYSSKRRVAHGKPKRHSPGTPWLFNINNSARLHGGLTPVVKTVEVSSVDDDNLLVKVTGENFHPEPSVHIGKRTLERGTDITHRSDGSLEFVAPKKELLENDVRVVGAEYGFSAPLVAPLESDDTGIAVHHFSFGPVRKGNLRDMTVYLTAANGACIPALHSRNVYVTFSDKIYEISPERWNADPKYTRCLSATVEVPIAHVKADSELAAQIPFLGHKYRGSSIFYQPTGVSQIELLESGDHKQMVWGIVGWGLASREKDKPLTIIKDIVVYAGDKYDATNGLSPVSEHLLTLTATKKTLSKQKKVLVFLPGYLEPISLLAPNVPAENKTPVITNQPESNVNSSRSVLFEGEGLTQIKKVTFEGTPLETLQTEHGLQVHVTRAVTEHKGSVELLGYVDENSFVVLKLVVK